MAPSVALKPRPPLPPKEALFMLADSGMLGAVGADRTDGDEVEVENEDEEEEEDEGVAERKGTVAEEEGA